MKITTKLLLGAASVAGIAAIAAPAMAQDAPPFALTGYLAVTTDYRFRGIAQNDRTPSPQGSLNLTGPEGFYVGSWASTVDWTRGDNDNPHAEVDIYGGKHTDLWGTDWNIEPYYYAYPAQETPAGAPSLDYFELINQLTHTFGALTATATWAWSPNFPADGGTGNYLAGTASYAVNDWFAISGNVGHQWAAAAKTVGSRDYTYFDIGGTLTYKSWALDLRYSGTDLGGTECNAFWMPTKNACTPTFLASVTYNFNLLP